MLRTLRMVNFSGSQKSQIFRNFSAESKINHLFLNPTTLSKRNLSSFNTCSHSQPSFFGLQSRKFSTNSYIEFIPPIYKNAKLVLPISVGRYNTTNAKQRERVGEEVNALLAKTSDMLKLGEITSVDVICTAGLHADWGNEKIHEVENLFFDLHSNLLPQQSAVYTWDGWIESVGQKNYQDTLKTITEKSQKGSTWYDLMVTTHKSVKMSSDLEFSLQYQRAEYAAIFLMQRYTNLVYLGQMSRAWSFIYEMFPDITLPVFTRATLKSKPPLMFTPADTSHTVRIIFELVEKTLVSPNFPDQEKIAIANSLTSLFDAYVPKSKVKNKNADDHDQNIIHTTHHLKG